MFDTYKKDMNKIHLSREQHARIINKISSRYEKKRKLQFWFKLVPVMALVLLVSALVLRINNVYQQYQLPQVATDYVVENSELVVVGKVNEKLLSFTVGGQSYNAYDVSILATYMGDRYQHVTLITDGCFFVSCITGTVNDASVDSEKYYLINMMTSSIQIPDNDLPLSVAYYAPYTWNSSEITRYNTSLDPNQQPSLTAWQKEIIKKAKKM